MSLLDPAIQSLFCGNEFVLVRLTGDCKWILSTFPHASAVLRSLGIRFSRACSMSTGRQILYLMGRGLPLICMGTCRLLCVTGQGHIEVTEKWICNELLCTSKEVAGLHWWFWADSINGTTQCENDIGELLKEWAYMMHKFSRWFALKGWALSGNITVQMENTIWLLTEELDIQSIFQRISTPSGSNGMYDVS